MSKIQRREEPHQQTLCRGYRAGSHFERESLADVNYNFCVANSIRWQTRSCTARYAAMLTWHSAWPSAWALRSMFSIWVAAPGAGWSVNIDLNAHALGHAL